MRNISALLTLLVLCGCGGNFSERVHEDVRRTFTAGPAPLVHVENVAGTVRIEGSSRPTVDVVATKYGYDAQELQKIAIGFAQEPGVVSITTSYSGGTHGGGVRYRISVPADASLRIGNVAGAVEIDGVGGNVEVETQAGAITANAGRVAGDRSIDLRATTGAIALTIAPGSSATVDANSTVGAFGSDIAGITQRRENLIGAHGGGTIGSGSARIALTTTAGAIALRER
jgi:hypothetical protein